MYISSNNSFFYLCFKHKNSVLKLYIIYVNTTFLFRIILVYHYIYKCFERKFFAVSYAVQLMPTAGACTMTLGAIPRKYPLAPASRKISFVAMTVEEYK